MIPRQDEAEIVVSVIVSADNYQEALLGHLDYRTIVLEAIKDGYYEVLEVTEGCTLE